MWKYFFEEQPSTAARKGAQMSSSSSLNFTSEPSTSAIKSETALSADGEVDNQDSSPSMPLPGARSLMKCVFFGLPFLTFHFKANKQFFDRHVLKLNRSYYISSPNRDLLVHILREFGDQLSTYPVKAGGCTLDVANITQLLVKQHKTIMLLGSKAKDEDAGTMTQIMKTLKIGIKLQEVEMGRTGVLVILHCKRRYSEFFFIDDIPLVNNSYVDRPSVTKVLERANIIYLSDFSMMIMPRICQMMAYYAFSRFKHLVLVLTRPDCLPSIKEGVMEILNYLDLLYLTPKSAAKLIEIFKIPHRFGCCTSGRNAMNIFYWLKARDKKSSTVIICDGLHKAYVLTDLSTGKVGKYKSSYAKESAVVDYYGVAAAFLGGFISMMLQGFQVGPCVNTGFLLADYVSRNFGVPGELASEDNLNQLRLEISRIIQSTDHRDNTMPFTIFQTFWGDQERTSSVEP